MKQIFENKIINIDKNYFDNKYVFSVPKNLKADFEINITKLLKKYKNENINYKKNYKLWNEVYSPKKELEIFEEIFTKSLKKNKKIHISNISLIEEILIIKKLYFDLWYFNKELNCFNIDFKNCPITIWVNIRNLIYSFKDYKNKKEEIFFIPPPREPKHQKALKWGINSWIISTITLNDIKKESLHLLELIKTEKINLLKISKNFYYNFKKIGFTIKEEIQLLIETK